MARPAWVNNLLQLQLLGRERQVGKAPATCLVPCVDPGLTLGRWLAGWAGHAQVLVVPVWAVDARVPVLPVAVGGWVLVLELVLPVVVAARAEVVSVVIAAVWVPALVLVLVLARVPLRLVAGVGVAGRALLVRSGVAVAGRGAVSRKSSADKSLTTCRRPRLVVCRFRMAMAPQWCV